MVAAAKGRLHMRRPAPVEVAVVVAACHLSPSHLPRTLRSLLGTTILRQIPRRRVSIPKKLSHRRLKTRPRRLAPLQQRRLAVAAVGERLETPRRLRFRAGAPPPLMWVELAAHRLEQPEAWQESAREA